MGTRITVPGAAFFDAPITPEVEDGCVGLFKLGRSVKASLINHAPGGADATLVAASVQPSVADGYLGLKGLAYYLDTPVGDSALFDRFVVFKSSDAISGTPNNPMPLGCYSSVSNLGGSSIYGASGGPLLAASVALNNGGVQSLPQISIAFASPNTFRLVRQRFDGTTHLLVDVTNNLSASATTALSRLVSTNSLRIGSGESSFGGLADVGPAFLYDRPLTDIEAALVIAQIRALCAADGITV